ncbi:MULTISPECIES: hypothetical protein [unclassified Knoellia]|uniref:hypothetical protein n=1 Tax=Knoellia altitudinis TaxID=3404795 RepID=UPI003605BDE7
MPLSRTRLAALLGVGAVVVSALVGCSSGPGEGQACPAPSAAPAAELALLPSGLSFDGVGEVTRVTSTQGHVNARAVSTQPLEELTVSIQDAVTAAGFRPAGMDNEGFEAEVFFTSGTYAAGQALVRAADCEGQWEIDLVLVDPSQLPSATPSPTTS